jgi:hypothetical protein
MTVSGEAELRASDASVVLPEHSLGVGASGDGGAKGFDVWSACLQVSF